MAIILSSVIYKAFSNVHFFRVRDRFQSIFFHQQVLHQKMGGLASKQAKMGFKSEWKFLWTFNKKEFALIIYLSFVN